MKNSLIFNYEYFEALIIQTKKISPTVSNLTNRKKMCFSYSSSLKTLKIPPTSKNQKVKTWNIYIMESCETDFCAMEKSN